jgi:hypothetical protein
MTLSRPSLTLGLLAILVSLVGVPLAQSATAAAPATDLSASLVARAAAQAPGLTVDRQAATHQSAASSSISSPSMTTSQAGELIVAFIMSDGSATTKQTISSVTGGGLSWGRRQRSNARSGTSEIWQAVAPTAVSNMVVKANRGNGSYTGSIVVAAFTGASVDGATTAAAGSTGAPTATLSPTRTGSWVWGVGNDGRRAVARTVGANQTKADEYLAPVGGTFWVQRQTAPSTSGSLTPVTINDTAPTNDRWNLALIEIPPATVITPPPDTSPPVISGVTVSAIGQTNATINWTTDEPASTQVAYGATSAYGTNTAINTSLTTSHSQMLSGLTASTTYHYQVRSADAAGNAAASVDAGFTTAAPVSFNPGNPNGTATVPAGMGLENVSTPDHVIGTGTAASCTSAAVLSAVTAGGIITFNCGPNPITITLTQTAKVRNSTAKLVIDGGGLVTLSGGNTNRILYTDTCDTSLGSVSGNCLYAPPGPQVTVQNITLADGNATNATYVSPGDTDQGSNGGGAIFQLGGRLKVVKSAFVRNTCAANGPDLGGAAIRVLAQHSATPNDLDGSQAALGQDPAYIVQSTFGGASGQGGNCSNGAISGLRTPITILNSLITYNNAIGCCSNPAWSGTPGGGSGGAVYTDGDTYDLNIAGTDIEFNTAKAGGSAIFYVSNDLTGHLSITNSVLKNNTYAPNGQPNNPHFETYRGIFYRGSGTPNFTGSTIQ